MQSKKQFQTIKSGDIILYTHYDTFTNQMLTHPFLVYTRGTGRFKNNLYCFRITSMIFKAKTIYKTFITPSENNGLTKPSYVCLDTPFLFKYNNNLKVLGRVTEEDFRHIIERRKVVDNFINESALKNY